MFKEFTQYITCMLGGECHDDKKETDKVIIENESEVPVVEEDKSVDEVDSQSSTPRMFTLTNKEKTDDCSDCCADGCADEGKDKNTDEE